MTRIGIVARATAFGWAQANICVSAIAQRASEGRTGVVS